MVKKVTLDTLDIEETTAIGKEKTPAGEQKEETSLVQRYFSRRFQGACLLMAGVVMLAGLAYWGMRGGKHASPAPVEQVVVVPSPGPPVKIMENNGELEGFFIPLKDGKGMDRVMVCDLVVAVDIQHKSLFREKILDVRNLVYETIHRKTARTLLSPGGREALGEEIRAGLTRLLGEDAVKSLYFTKYLVL